MAALPNMPCLTRLNRSRVFETPLFGRDMKSTRKSWFWRLAALHAMATLSAAAPAQPPDAQAIRERAFAASEAGAANLAFDLAYYHRDAFSDLEYYRLQHAAIAQRLRWGRTEMWHLTGPERFDILDGALQEGRQLLAQLPDQREYADLRVAAMNDMIYGLATRGRMEETTALFEQRQSLAQPVPPYVRVAAADAYSYLEQYDKAIENYERALAEAAPGDLDRVTVRESLFYAYLDRGRVEDAATELELMEKESPMYVELAPEPERPNEDYQRVQSLRAQYLLYTGRSETGGATLNALRHDAPFSSSLRNLAAEFRHHDARPREARQAYETSLLEIPDDTRALTGLGNVLLDLREYEKAESIVQSLADRFPESAAVRNLQRNYDAYDSPLLTVDAGAGFGENGPSVIARREWSVDTRLYSQPIDYRWRVFAQQFTAHADANGGSEWRIRNGIGVDYRRMEVTASLQAHRSTGTHGRFGLTGTVDYYPSDGWRLSASVDTDSNDLPWQAFQQGVHGWTSSVSLRRQPNDRTYYDLAYGLSRYSDSNTRQQIGASWYQLVHSAPRHSVATWTSVGYSHNSRSDVDYFSPSNDLTGQVTAMYEWRPWRDGQYVFRQRVYGTAGMYRQHGESVSGLWEIRLEQAWDLPKRATLTYGVGFGRRSYDGEPENRTMVYLGVSLPF